MRSLQILVLPHKKLACCPWDALYGRKPSLHPIQLVSSEQALAWILVCVSGGSMRLMALKAASKNPGARVTTRCDSVSGYMSPVMLSVGSSRSFTLAMSLYTFRGKT